MADNQDENLVSEIKVTGGEEGAAEIKKFADDGAASFGKLGEAADKAAGRVNKSSDNIVKSYRQVGNAGKQVGAAAPGIDRVGASLGDLEKYTSNFTASIPRTIQSVSQFAKKLAVLGSAAAAAGVGLVVAAKKVVGAVDGQSDALDKQTAAQIDANNAALQGELAQINYEASLRQLNKQLATGAIGYLDYVKQVRSTNDSYREQQRVAAQVAEAQARVKEENDRLTKSLADRKAYTQLIDAIGGPLVTAFTALGRQTEAIRVKFRDAFGPSAAAVVDVITNTLSKNSDSISKFFDNASKKIEDLLTKNGPAIQKLLENIGAGAANVFNGLIDAAPALIDFINNQVVPAIKGIMDTLNALADLINSVFGTKLTGGFIVLIAILGATTGAFKALFSTVGLAVRGILVLAGIISTAFSIPMAAAIAVVVALGAALYLLYTQVDWAAFGQKVVAAWQSIVQWFNNARASGAAAANSIIDAWNGLVGWFSSTWAGITAIFEAVWQAIKDGATATVQFFVDAWNGFVETLKGIGDKIVETFNNAIDTIKSYWDSGINAISGYLQNLYSQALQYLQPIIDMLKTISGLAGGGAAGGAVPAYASGGKVSGPGTGTSDSIMAKLSNGEFVVKASSVMKYGVGLLHAINSGNFRMPHFADGGLASISPSPVPSFAGVGGEERGIALQPLNLSLFGEEFKGLMMPEDVGRRMTKFAIAKQTRSAGRKPAWIGRGRT